MVERCIRQNLFGNVEFLDFRALVIANSIKWVKFLVSLLSKVFHSAQLFRRNSDTFFQVEHERLFSGRKSIVTGDLNSVNVFSWVNRANLNRKGNIIKKSSPFSEYVFKQISNIDHFDFLIILSAFQSPLRLKIKQWSTPMCINIKKTVSRRITRKSQRIFYNSVKAWGARKKPNH